MPTDSSLMVSTRITGFTEGSARTRGLLLSTPAFSLSASEVPSDEAGASGTEAHDRGFCSFYSVHGAVEQSIISCSAHGRLANLSTVLHLAAASLPESIEVLMRHCRLQETLATARSIC